MANSNEIDIKKPAELAPPGSQENPVCLLSVCHEIAGHLSKHWPQEFKDLVVGSRQETAKEFGLATMAYALVGKSSPHDDVYHYP
ncbi:MAG TPA: hypothetical protein V6D22_03760 [Candidatus Obscuribacterales bacterium]